MSDQKTTEQNPITDVIKTLTGIPMTQAITMLDEALEPGAYKAVPGAVDLTDIKPAWLTEYLNKVFGICGYGWWFMYDQRDLRVTTQDNGKRTVYEAAIDRLELYYRLLVNGEMIVAGPVLSNGGSDNGVREYAIRGALTNALGAAASKLGWQLSVYQDKRGHNGKGDGSDQAKAKAMQAARKAREAAKPADPTSAQPTPDGNGKLTLEEALAVVMPFGTRSNPSVKGKTLGEIEQSQPKLIDWLAENAKQDDLKAAAAVIVAARPKAEAKPEAEGTGAMALTLKQARAIKLPFKMKNVEKGTTLGAVEDTEPGAIDFLTGSRYPDIAAAAKTIVAQRASNH